MSTISMGASSFLETALLVDDLARFPTTPSGDILAAATATADDATDEEEIEDSFEDVLDAKREGRHEEVSSGAEVVADGTNSHEDAASDGYFSHDAIRAGQVVDGFAELGIACTALAPHAEGAVDPADANRIGVLAKRVDLLVIDWYLRIAGPLPSDGAIGNRVTSRSLIEELITSDRDDGGRLRTICVYTGADNPRDVFAQLIEIAESVYPGEVKEQDDSLMCTTQTLCMFVVAKPHGVAATSLSEPKDFPMARESELPALLVQRFGTFADGLLQGYALAALSAVRRSAHGVIARFDKQLDAGLLSHRALVGAEATEEFARLLVRDELDVALRPGPLSDFFSNAAVEETLDRFLNDGGDGQRSLASHAFAAEKLQIPVDQVRGLFMDGLGSAGFKRKDLGLEQSVRVASLTELLFTGELAGDHAINSDLRLASISTMSRDLTSHRANMLAPALQLGTILRLHDAKGDLVYVCLQPVCDCVRVDKPRRFPLLPLRVIKKPTEDTYFDLTVPVSPSGELMMLSSRRAKFSDLLSVEFEPQGGLIRASNVEPGSWVFQGEGSDFHWLGELRPWIASRLATTVSQGASRIGLVESEFQRVAGSSFS